MNLNVIVDLQFSKPTFLIKSIALKCNKKGAKSVPFEFGYNDRDPADHPNLLPKATLAKLKRKAQSVYRTLNGDELTEYYDLSLQMFRYRGVLLAPVPGERTSIDKGYNLETNPDDFISEPRIGCIPQAARC